MKSSKTTICFVFDILLALAGSACFNPNSAILSPARESGTDIAAAAFNDIEPFIVSIAVGGDGSSRSIAGLPRDKLKAGTGVRNFAQLIVLDTASKKIMGFAEIHQSETIRIDALPLGRTYAFFLLMGHWETGASAPTLLNVGLTECPLNTEGHTDINIEMYPLVVNTVFVDWGPSGTGRIVEPVVVDGIPHPADLSPGDWKVEWTIRRTNEGTDGLDRLRVAQAIMENPWYELERDRYTDRHLNVRGLTFTMSDGTVVLPLPSPAVTAISNVIEWDISAYTQTTGKWGAVNFNVEYVPFDLISPHDWRIAYSGKRVDTAFDLDGGQAPTWIIRNGVNDQAPDGNTDFAHFGTDAGSNPHANANGAVQFVVGPRTETQVPSDPNAALLIKDGALSWKQPASPQRNIRFTTDGYTGYAGVYYTITPPGAGAPEYLSAYTGSLGAVAAGNHLDKEITLPGEDVYDVYVLICQGSDVSAPVKINTEFKGRIVAKTNTIVGSIFWSGDGGETWIRGTVPQVNAYTRVEDIAYGNGRFAAVLGTPGDGLLPASLGDKTLWSDDGGETWTAGTLDTPSLLRHVAYGNGQFVALPLMLKDAFVSSDGKTWTAKPLPSGLQDIRWAGLVFGKNAGAAAGTFVGIPNYAENPDYYYTSYGANDQNYLLHTAVSKTIYSSNGSSFSTSSTVNMPITNYRKTAYGDGGFLMVQEGGNTYWSPDGTTWTKQAAFGRRIPHALVFGYDRFLMGTEETNYNYGMYKSTDKGVTWKKVSSAPSTGYYNGIYIENYGAKGRFLFGAWSSVYWSDDLGDTWQSAKSAFLQSFTYGEPVEKP
ncbi:MAG: hypothetical protein LBG08_04905 [Spirochaetaceae bacterium]|jgi:hypothetical protein|nr:hypothetical protein [Spirochaetaceae bacterium]